MDGITVTPDIAWEHTANQTFMMRPSWALNLDNDILTAAIIHDSHHAHTGTGGNKEEKAASSFAIGPALKIGLSDAAIQWLCTDSKFGHKPPSNSPYNLKQKKSN